MSKKQETINIKDLFQQLRREKLAFAFIMSFSILVAFSYSAFVKPRLLKNFELFEMQDSNITYHLFKNNQKLGFAFSQIFHSEILNGSPSSVFFSRILEDINKKDFDLFISRNYSKYPNLKKPGSFRMNVIKGSHLYLSLQYEQNVPGEKILLDYISYKIQEIIDFEKAYVLFLKQKNIENLQSFPSTAEIKITSEVSSGMGVTQINKIDMIASLQKEMRTLENIEIKINIDNLKFMYRDIDVVRTFPKTLPLLISLFIGSLSFIIFVNLKTLSPIRGK